MARIVHLHRLLQSGDPVTAVSLVGELEVSVRTIKPDIELMRDQLGVPIAWNGSTRSYHYTHHCDLLPLLRLGADEAIALALAGRTFSAWQGSPLGAALTSAFAKIAPIVRGAVSFPAEALEPLLFSRDDPAAPAEHRYFAVLLEAIHRRRELRLTYRKPKGSGRAELREVHPLHLAWLEHRWMLVAHDPARGALRNFVLARIEAIEASGRPFAPPAGFNAQQYLGGSLGRFTGERCVTVRLRVDSVAAPYLRERPWHPSQQITETPAGHTQVVLQLNNLIDVERRILAAGGHITVLEPPELRSAVRAAAARLAQAHVEGALESGI